MNRPVQQLPAAPADPRVSLAIEPDAARTRDVLRWLIGKARAWKAAQQTNDKAA